MYGCDYDDNAFTQDEIEAGIPSLIYCHDEFDENSNGEIQISQLDTYKKNIRISKKIANFSSNNQIKDYLFKETLAEHLPSLIVQYKKEEVLPSKYVTIAMDENCLTILIKEIFKKNRIALTDNNVQEIDVFVEKIYANNRTIVYDRVSELQAFIHNKIDSAKGEFAHLELGVVNMRNLLSASRLHLNIFDIRNFNIDEILYIFYKTQHDKEKESLSPKVYIPRPKKSPKHTQIGYIADWRYEKMKSIYDYMDHSTYSKFSKIVSLDTNQNIENFRNLALNAMV